MKNESMELNISETHKLIVDNLNKVYGPKHFKKRKLISSTTLHEDVSWEEIHRLAIVCSRILNMHGASVGEINLYKLFDAYFLDPEKRREINAVL